MGNRPDLSVDPPGSEASRHEDAPQPFENLLRSAGGLDRFGIEPFEADLEPLFRSGMV